ncbi:MAG: 30S ribosomal protein S4 [Atopobiaceae bacterium]|nr:30S ribosomal protein S4 [Atopobiaceae bacterium]
MAIDRTPVLKRCRQLGIDPVVMGINKESKREPRRRRRQESEYGAQLREKQKAKFIYGVLEKQFRGYYDKALKVEGITGDNLMSILESRLDNVVFRLGFARTRKEARQTVRHGHIEVNGHRVDIPSYQVKAGDVISVASKYKDLLPIKEALIRTEHMAVPSWLEVDIEKLRGTVLQLPTRDQIDLELDAQLIVELYSK